MICLPIAIARGFSHRFDCHHCYAYTSTAGFEPFEEQKAASSHDPADLDSFKGSTGSKIKRGWPEFTRSELSGYSSPKSTKLAKLKPQFRP